MQMKNRECPSKTRRQQQNKDKKMNDETKTRKWMQDGMLPQWREWQNEDNMMRGQRPKADQHRQDEHDVQESTRRKQWHNQCNKKNAKENTVAVQHKRRTEIDGHCNKPIKRTTSQENNREWPQAQESAKKQEHKNQTLWLCNAKEEQRMQHELINTTRSMTTGTVECQQQQQWWPKTDQMTRTKKMMAKSQGTWRMWRCQEQRKKNEMTTMIAMENNNNDKNTTMEKSQTRRTAMWQCDGPIQGVLGPNNTTAYHSAEMH